MYVLQRTPDGKFVADMRKSRDGKSYTRNLLRAKVFESRADAEYDRCPGNERIVQVEELLRGG